MAYLREIPFHHFQLYKKKLKILHVLAPFSSENALVMESSNSAVQLCLYIDRLEKLFFIEVGTIKD